MRDEDALRNAILEAEQILCPFLTHLNWASPIDTATTLCQTAPVITKPVMVFFRGFYLMMTAIMLQPVLSLSADNVRVECPSKDELLKRDVTVVCKDVVSVFGKTVGKPPALGIKPFVIQQAPDDTPRAVINDMPNVYRINLTCVNTRFYQQITYQLAHELTHHYVNPYKEGWFVESVAMAGSLLTLTAMGDKWSANAPFANWKISAYQFAEYRASTVSNQLAKLNLSHEKVSLWIKKDLPGLVANNKVGRPEQTVCALAIEEAVRKHPGSWGAICNLGESMDKDGRVDFDKWASLVESVERPFVQELAYIFSAPLSKTQITSDATANSD